MTIILLLNLALMAMTPITLAAVGEILAERAGVVNIGLEGILVISAFTAVVGTKATHNVWIGLLTGILTGIVLGLIHGGLSIYLKGDQIISPVGINLFGLGIVGFGIVSLWGGPLQLSRPLQVPHIFVPFLGKISPISILMFLLVFFTWWLLFRTDLGLKIRSLGIKPVSGDVMGLNVKKLRLMAVIYGASLCGLGGAFLSLDWTHTITRTLPAGRGFIALAIVVFAKLNPLLALLGGFIFGFFDALAIWISNIPAMANIIPYQFLRMIPYISTLIILAGAIGEAKFPKEIGKPYYRE